MSTRCRACDYSTTPFCAKHQREFERAGESLCVSFGKQLIDRIDNHERGVNEWESEFVESCIRRLDEGKPLTNKQSAKAHEILDEMDRKGGTS